MTSGPRKAVPTRAGEPARVGGLLAALAAAAAAAAWALYKTFTSFAPYDDEGYIIVSVRQFAAGRALYDEVYTQYGPTFYFFNDAVHWLTGAEASSDTARVQTAVIWVACSLVAASTVWALTRSGVATATAVVATCAALTGLAPEPAHPQALSLLLVVAIPAIAAWTAPRHEVAFCAIAGVAVGCLLTIKANLGLFAGAALGLWIASRLEGRTGAAARLACGAGVVAAPAILMRVHLTDPSFAWYAALCTIAAASAVAVHWRASDTTALGLRHVAAFAVAATAVVAGCFAATVLHGTSPAGFLDGLVLQHMSFASTWHLAPNFRREDVLVAAIGLAVCLAVAVRRPTHPYFSLALALTKIAFGVILLDARALLPNSDPCGWALGWIWLVAVDPPGVAGGLHPDCRRLLLAVAATSALQAYPVAGTQAFLATALAVPVAVVCVADGVRALLALTAASSVTARVVPAVLTLLLAGYLAETARAVYADVQAPSNSSALDLPGARYLRQPERRVAAFRWLAVNLAAHGDVILSDPGLNSFYLWTEKPPPTPLNAAAWPIMFDAERQQRIVEVVSDVPRIAVVRNEALGEIWRIREPAAPMPLDAFLASEFEKRGSFDGYDFLVRRGLGEVALVYAAEYDESGYLVVSLPPLGDRSISRIEVFDCDRVEVLADMGAGGPAGPIADLDASADLPDLREGSIDVRRARRLRLPFRGATTPQGSAVVVRLFDDDGVMFAPVPVVR